MVSFRRILFHRINQTNSILSTHVNTIQRNDSLQNHSEQSVKDSLSINSNGQFPWNIVPQNCSNQQYTHVNTRQRTHFKTILNNLLRVLLRSNNNGQFPWNIVQEVTKFGHKYLTNYFAEFVCQHIR